MSRAWLNQLFARPQSRIRLSPGRSRRPGKLHISLVHADMLNSTLPTTKEGIEKHLGSGMVKGISPIYAKKLVASRGSTAIEPDQFKCSIISRLFFLAVGVETFEGRNVGVCGGANEVADMNFCN